MQQQAIYAATSPRIRMLETRIAALEKLVDEQRAARAVPGADGKAAQPASELDVELAPIDARLKFIAEEKATIEKTLADLDTSIQATPANEHGAGRARARARQPPEPVQRRRRQHSARPRSASGSRCCPRASASR